MVGAAVANERDDRVEPRSSVAVALESGRRPSGGRGCSRVPCRAPGMESSSPSASGNNSAKPTISSSSRPRTARRPRARRTRRRATAGSTRRTAAGRRDRELDCLAVVARIDWAKRNHRRWHQTAGRIPRDRSRTGTPRLAARLFFDSSSCSRSHRSRRCSPTTRRSRGSGAACSCWPRSGGRGRPTR